MRLLNYMPKKTWTRKLLGALLLSKSKERRQYPDLFSFLERVARRGFSVARDALIKDEKWQSCAGACSGSFGPFGLPQENKILPFRQWMNNLWVGWLSTSLSS
jgi:hypothetical protein